jgi:hypothetical protein
VIVEGNAPLAAAYAINIIAIFQTYRWNSYVEAHRNDPKVWHGLVDNDTWQADYLTGEHLAETKFWLGEKSMSPAAVTPRGAARAASVPGLPASPLAIHAVFTSGTANPTASATPAATRKTKRRPKT